ncbi:hypothetical protein C2857_005507 [Epichloe festucae Fl1]|uniref:Uncharacterized protein n=1 Tax=Epichloe festucae (strain Fl1) TaxID=877507 RepID=A0A7S9PU73_EPIFF|nr:hypothetical protein C2857_005507 [Epichloe festucae Fl1]
MSSPRCCLSQGPPALQHILCQHEPAQANAYENKDQQTKYGQSMAGSAGWGSLKEQRLGQMNEEEKVQTNLCVQLSTYMPTTHHACFRGFDAEGTIQGMDKGKRSFDPFCICLEKKRWTP